MELHSILAQGALAVHPVDHAAPPPAQSDGRAVADVVASKTDPRPEVPLPMPAGTSQSALVSKATVPEEETEAKSAIDGGSSAERTLKPYGINMLPEKTDKPSDDTPHPDLQV